MILDIDYRCQTLSSHQIADCCLYETYEIIIISIPIVVINVKTYFLLRFKNEIKGIIGYWPKDLSLYKLELRHSSAYPFQKKKGERNNERLEYLGDAVIDLVVAEALFYRFPKEDEGYLTKLRSKLVSRNNLNRVADELGLPNMLVGNLKGNHGHSI